MMTLETARHFVGRQIRASLEVPVMGGALAIAAGTLWTLEELVEGPPLTVIASIELGPRKINVAAGEEVLRCFEPATGSFQGGQRTVNFVDRKPSAPMRQEVHLQPYRSTAPMHEVQAEPCKCGRCKTCADNFRWERIYLKMFADPEYYTRPWLRHSSALSGL